MRNNISAKSAGVAVALTVLFLAGSASAQAVTFSSQFGVGTQDQDVTNLQTWLTSSGYYNGPVTGYFGTLTQAAVEQYQTAQGISATGFVGPLTLAALNQSGGGTTMTGSTGTSGNAAEIAQLELELNSLLAQIKTLEAASSTSMTALSGSNLSLQTNTGVSASGTLTASGSGPYTFTLATNPVNGAVTSFAASTGAFVYTPHTNYTGSDSFTYTVGNGSMTSSPATVSIVVQATSSGMTMIPAPPVGQILSLQTTGDAAKSSTLAATGGGPYMFQIVSVPAHGTISNLGTTSGAFTYTPTSGYYGSDTFTYSVGNGSATSTAYTVTVTNGY